MGLEGVDFTKGTTPEESGASFLMVGLGEVGLTSCQNEEVIVHHGQL